MEKPDAYNVAYYDNILSVAHEGVVAVDNEGIVFWINSAFTEITGYSEYDIIGKPFIF